MHVTVPILFPSNVVEEPTPRSVAPASPLHLSAPRHCAAVCRVLVPKEATACARLTTARLAQKYLADECICDRQLRTSEQAKEARLILSSSHVGLGVDFGHFHCPQCAFP